MTKIAILAVAVALSSFGATAMAQYSGPAPVSRPAEPYRGPSLAPLMTVKQMLDNGRDRQYARLQGRIVSHDGGKNYTFADDTGRLTVEISEKSFPAGQTIDANQRVELVGDIDKDIGGMEFEVEQVHVQP